MDASTSQSRGERTRRALLESAIDRFSRDGFRTTSVADISRDAGVGPTTAYVHYPNKEALFLAAVDDDLDSLFDQIVPLIDAVSPDDDLTGSLFAGLLGVVDEHPLARRLLAGLEPAITERVLATDAFERLRATVADRMAEQQAEGELRPDLDAALLADGVISIVVSLLMSAIQIGRGVLDVRGAGLAEAFRAIFSPDPRLDG